MHDGEKNVCLTSVILIQEFNFLCIDIVSHAPTVYYIEVGSAGAEECVCACCHMSNICFSESWGIHQHQIPTFGCSLEYFNKGVEYKAVVSTLIHNTSLCVKECIEYNTVVRGNALIAITWRHFLFSWRNFSAISSAPTATVTLSVVEISCSSLGQSLPP